MTSFQDFKISRMPMPKETEFLKRLYVDIKGYLVVTFTEVGYFLSIKNNTWNIFFVLSKRRDLR